ncbi:unnamed protein product [Bursaphelenchus okinawaensis]|uniref:Uncharacterized protein n=1 Tax=Bursaphelenchus okinawaensis TaxID=465554 RepID=A0A811KFG3_9BILA|nr:unnamed protein product [Bursaphelenchus okinawaensis]CAG9103542.1 unnamed protein product [Bursaphelenchus okinawaensis]
MSGRMANNYTFFDGRLHVVHASFIALGLNMAVSLFAVNFFPGWLKLAPALVILLIHALIAFGVQQRISAIILMAMGLFGVLYVGGLITSIVFLIMEDLDPRRGSYKLYLLHVSSMSAVLTNTIIVMLYVFNKLHSFIQDSYSNLNTEIM